MGERCEFSLSGSGAKPQPPTILVHLEDLETLLMTSRMCIVLRTWCSSLPIPASTELTKFLYILCRKKLPHFFRRPSLAPGGICPCPLPAATGASDSLAIFSCLFWLIHWLMWLKYWSSRVEREFSRLWRLNITVSYRSDYLICLSKHGRLMKYVICMRPTMKYLQQWFINQHPSSQSLSVTPTPPVGYWSNVAEITRQRAHPCPCDNRTIHNLSNLRCGFMCNKIK